MLSGLPKILGRGFIVGFVLPSVLFCLYLQNLALNFLEAPSLSGAIESLKLTPFVLLVLIVSILLMALNRNIIRTLEGYGGLLNPFFVFKFWHLYRWDRYIEPVMREAKTLTDNRKRIDGAKSAFPNFSIKLIKALDSYPAKRASVLPTSFGNAMRSFEGYSGVVYGLDAIPLWPHLSLILSKETKEQVQDGRALIDFSANLFVLSLIAMPIVLYKYYDQPLNAINISTMAVPLCSAIYAWLNLPTAARQWGVVVKSTIDISRAKLSKELGLELPEDAEKEKKMWGHVSRYMLFRQEDDYLALNEFRKKDKPKQPKLVLQLPGQN